MMRLKFTEMEVIDVATYLVSQPIFEIKTENVYGYALIYRENLEEETDNNNISAAKTISQLFSRPESMQMLDNKPAVITFTDKLLNENIAHLFSKDKLIICVDDDVAIQSALMDKIAVLKDEGYVFALNNFTFNQRCLNLLTLVSAVVLDLRNLTDAELKNIVQVCSGMGKKLIAKGVDTEEAFQRAKEFGFQMVQGNYFSENKVSEIEDDIEYSQASFFRLVEELTKDNPDFDKVDEIISSDVTMSYKLLRLVNSVYFSLRNRVSTVKQAVIIVGMKQLRDWVYLLSFEDVADAKTTELLRLSFMRGAMCQELAMEVPTLQDRASECYLVGMFSTLDTLMKAPMAKLLTDLPLTDAVKDALLDGAGTMGDLLNLVLAYENGKWMDVSRLSGKLGLADNSIGRVYMVCMEKVKDTWSRLMMGD